MSDLTPEYRIIKDEIMPAVMERFLSKAGDYGDAWKLLGAKGQFSDINRKFWKLYNSVWEGRELKGEQPAECAEDIIGHCLLLLLIFHQEGGGARTPDRASFSSPEELVPPTLPASGAGRVGEDGTRCSASRATVGLGLLRCELYKGHKGSNHLANVGTPNQHQWRE